MKVLVVDDEASISRALKRAFTACGHSVKTAACGEEAKDHLLNSSFDLMMVDLIMPDCTGDQIVQWATEQKIQIRVAMMTAYLDKQIDELRHTHGIEKVYRKPFKDIFSIVADLDQKSGT